MSIQDFSNFVKVLLLYYKFFQIFKYNIDPTVGGVLKEFGFAANIY